LLLFIRELVMKAFGRSQLLMVAGLLLAAPALAQSPQGQKQPTQDGNSPTTVGPGSAASKQQTQNMAHSDPSGAKKQKTQGDLPEVGPASGAYKGNVPRSQY
jgi:hypothetical protein